MHSFNYTSMLKPSKARILRIEISNPGLPDSLTDLITSKKVDSHVSEFLYRRQVFQEEHDTAVRHYLGVPDDAECTFGKYVVRYIDLKKRYVRNVLCFGNFIHFKSLPQFLQEAKDFEKELDDLRLKVRLFLNERFNLKWNDILRFNPRLRFATFLLSESLVKDDDFRRQVLHMKEPFNESQDVDDLLGTDTSSDTVWEMDAMMQNNMITGGN